MSLAAVLAAGMSAAAGARAESPWYVSGDVGGYFREGFTRSFPPPPANLAVPGSFIVSSERVAIDPGLTGHLAVGYRVSPHWRVEAELGFAADQASKVYPTLLDPFPGLPSTYPRRSGGGFQRLSEGVNVFYDFKPLWGRFTPYAGAGLGVWEGRENSGAYGGWNFIVNGQAVSSPSVVLAGGSETEGFGMVEGGVNVRLTRHWSVVPAYRYVRGFDSASNLGGDVAHIAKLGVRYAF